MFRGFLAGIQFLTRIPVPLSFSEAETCASVPWFPAVGLCLGGCAALLYRGLHVLRMSPLFCSFAAVVFLAALNGGMHLDGLADTADGMLSSRDRERTLEIMKDSRVGTMGVLALIFVLGFKVFSVAELPVGLACKFLLLAPAAGKMAQVAAMLFFSYIHPHGLAELFVRGVRPWHMFSGVVLLLFVVWLCGPWGVLVLATGQLPGTLLNFRCRVRLGGISGDTLGALSELTEAATLSSAALFAGLLR